MEITFRGLDGTPVHTEREKTSEKGHRGPSVFRVGFYYDWRFQNEKKRRACLWKTLETKQFGSIKSLYRRLINICVVTEEQLIMFCSFCHLRHNWNVNLFHSHPERSYSETFVSIKHWLFSKTQCSMEYSYPSGSGDSRSHSLPHSLQLERSLKDVIQTEIKK